MTTPETGPAGVVFWNTWYRAGADDQLEHLEWVEERLLERGIGNMLLCLSEATYHTEGGGLINKLRKSGFDTDWRSTSDLRDGREEALCFAKRGQLQPVEFVQLNQVRGISNQKTRWLGATSLAGTRIFSAHTSYPWPRKKELDGIARQLSADRLTHNEGFVVGGDFNTVVDKQVLFDAFRGLGLLKVYDANNHHRTIRWAPPGLNELDHAFVSEDLQQRTTLDILPRGPSNHHPLVLTLE